MTTVTSLDDGGPVGCVAVDSNSGRRPLGSYTAPRIAWYGLVFVNNAGTDTALAMAVVS